MCMTCMILVPQPGIEAGPAAVEVLSPNHWMVREVLKFSEYFYYVGLTKEFPEKDLKYGAQSVGGRKRH